ncbi:MAG: family 10 glycosylhydrolase [Phycisphaerae bacterium]|nr:family 10 glycosylhydrolase [Phycisphaerae bacterium]
MKSLAGSGISRFVLTALAIVGVGLHDRCLASEPSSSDKAKIEEAKRQRKEAAHRKRRILYDNDGNEPVYYMKKPSADELLERRTKGVVGSHVDTIVYCTWSSGFSIFTHNTKIGEVFDCTAPNPKKGALGFENNQTRALIEQGTDPLKIMVGFCRKNKIEVFWSFRMNDTHDAWGGWYSPYLFPKLKKEHPEWLVASRDKRSKVGGWSAVDYGVPEIRDLASKFVEEVCENYDVDGVMLDFFRHPVYFKKHAWGEACGQEELDQMTSLVRRVQEMTGRVAVKRGHPILVAARTPDSVEYCRNMGLDVERWMKEGLIDLWVTSGYFRLSPLEENVQLAHKYGVPIYPCLSETRMRDKEAGKIRGSLGCYRGRAMNVWDSGADGVYMFNYFNPKSTLWRELGDPKVLTGLDRVYTTGARGVNVVGRWTVGGKRFVKHSPVSPENPRDLRPGKPVRIELRVGEKMQETLPSDVKLQLRVEGLGEGQSPSVTLNGTSLPSTGVARGWASYAVKAELVKDGMNQIEVSVGAESKGKTVLKDVVLRVWPR